MATSTEESGKPRGGTLGGPSWVWLVSVGALLVIGWGFILFTNNLHLTAPVVFVCLGYGAGVAAVYTLFRTGSSAVAGGEPEDDGGWGRPLGAIGELEREKRALVKAIKEAEFDLEMGKLSQADAEAMIARYRAQAIEVIKEIDRKGGEGTTREQIEREVRARLELAKSRKSGEDKRGQGKQAASKGKKPPAVEAKPAKSAKSAKSVAGPEAPIEAPVEASVEAPAEAPADAPPEAPAEAPAEAPIEAPIEAPAEAPAEADTEDPDAGARGASADAAKEATP